MVWNTGPINEFGIIPTGYERRLPPEVQLLVRARRRAVMDRASGRVLDLGGADTHRQLWRQRPELEVTILDRNDDARLRSLAEQGAVFDSIVSVFQLASTADVERTSELLAAVLHPDGHLLFLEPGRQTGVAGRVQHLAAPSIAITSRWRVDRDIPASLRRRGLSVTDLERHRVPTLQWWLRVVLEGTAHRARPAHQPTGTP